MQKVVKYFNSLLLKTLFKLKDKTNIFFINNSTVSNFNKILITFISLLFLYLFYLSIPTLYSKTWVQNTLERKLFEDFNINFSNSSDILYSILPSPHFTIKNSKIFKDNIENVETLANIKKLKVFIYQKNFFIKEKLDIKRVVIDDANFPLKLSDFDFFNELSNKKFSNKKIIIKKSNIFFKDDDNETISIIKIPDGYLFHDNLKILNTLNFNGEIFNIPFIFNLIKKVLPSGNKEINIESKKLKLNIFNESIKDSENYISGLNTVSILNSKIYTRYDIRDNSISFYSDNSKINYSNVKYNGNLSFKPFDLKLDLEIKEYDFTKNLNTNLVIGELIKTKILFNDNISTNISVDLDLRKNKYFDFAKLKFKIINGDVTLNNSQLINDEIGLLELNDSNLFFEKNKLILNTNVEIKIRNLDSLYSFLQTPKKSRKPIKNILINLDYDFLNQEVSFNRVNIDGKDDNEEITNLIRDFEYNKYSNFNKTRILVNKLINFYEG